MKAPAKRKRGRPTNASRIAATAYPSNIRDGASTPGAIRTRLRLLAIERGVDDSEIRAAWSTHPDDVFQFAERHRVSLQWLICGKLAGLLETVRGLPGCGGPDSVHPIIRHAQLCEFDKVLASIDKRKMPMVLAVLRTFLNEARHEKVQPRGGRRRPGRNGSRPKSIPPPRSGPRPIAI